MRSWFNSILSFIGTESLTDGEYQAMNVSDVEVNVYNQASYDALASVLEAREAISSLQNRLIGLFQAKGFDVEGNDVGTSQIYLGSVLDDC